MRAEWIPLDTRVEEFETAIRTVCEPIFSKPISEISFGAVLLQLFQTVRRFEIPIQPQLVLLYKTLLNIEGLGRQLYPQLNLWDSAKPFLEDWMKKQHSPQALLDDLKRDWPRWRALLPKLPQILESMAEQRNGSEQAELAALRSQLLDQQNKSRQQKFHLLLGFGLALAGLAIYLLVESGVIATSGLSKSAPWIGGCGLLWAYLKSR